jgi:hypothetical protein
VVNVAKSQEHISSACGADFSFVRRLEHSYHDLTINRAIALELLLEGLRARSPSHRFVKLTVVFEKGRHDLGKPSVPGSDLDHGHVGLNPEESERFQAMAIFVAGLICRETSPSGEPLIASQTDNPELLWALRGGGGNLGVVTAFTYRLHPVDKVLAGFLAFPLAQSTRVLRLVGEFAKRALDELALIVMDDRRLTADHALCVLICWSGELRNGEEVLAEIRSFGRPSADSIGLVSYFDFQRVLDAAPLDEHAVADIDFISEIEAQTAEALTACIASAPSDTVSHSNSFTALPADSRSPTRLSPCASPDSLFISWLPRAADHPSSKPMGGSSVLGRHYAPCRLATPT